MSGEVSAVGDQTINLQLSDIPDNGAKIIEVDERLKVAVFRVGERCAAINNRCPHAGGSLGEGEFDGTEVQCPLHGFRVDVWKGVGNAGKPVQKYEIAVNGDAVELRIPTAD
jgi:nitrite reductase/ring-hydroxylating ferredoxin subunit